MMVYLLHRRSTRTDLSGLLPLREPDAVVAATGSILVVPFILAMGVPWYLILAFTAGPDADNWLLVAILAGAFVTVGIYFAIVLVTFHVWLTESGIVVRSPFAPRFATVMLPLEDCSRIYIRGRRIWWRPPIRSMTSLILWTSPTRFRSRVAMLPSYSVVDAWRAQ